MVSLLDCFIQISHLICQSFFLPPPSSFSNPTPLNFRNSLPTPLPPQTPLIRLKWSIAIWHFPAKVTLPAVDWMRSLKNPQSSSAILKLRNPPFLIRHFGLCDPSSRNQRIRYHLEIDNYNSRIFFLGIRAFKWNEITMVTYICVFICMYFHKILTYLILNQFNSSFLFQFICIWWS